MENELKVPFPLTFSFLLFNIMFYVQSIFYCKDSLSYI